MEPLEILRWVASILGMIAALMVSYNGGAKLTGIGFIVFTVSSILWVIAGVLDGNSPLAIQNVVLFAINLFGVYQYLWPLVGRSDEGSQAEPEPER